MRFDRVHHQSAVLQNYIGEHPFPERFRVRLAPETGKKADLMFVQHMLAVLEADGMVATVMPHGVLFRGGEEKEIRSGFIERDCSKP